MHAIERMGVYLPPDFLVLEPVSVEALPAESHTGTRLKPLTSGLPGRARARPDARGAAPGRGVG